MEIFLSLLPKDSFHLELMLRIILSCFIGYMIGYERKSRDKSAGMRTHAIVGLGAALMMIISKYGFGDVPDYDASRVASQIVSGVGFLGAGIIFVKKQYGQRPDHRRRALGYCRRWNGNWRRFLFYRYLHWFSHCIYPNPSSPDFLSFFRTDERIYEADYR